MKKTALAIILILFVNLLGYALYLFKMSPVQKNTVYIAIVGPLEQEEGRDMLRAVNLHLKEIHYRVGGKAIRLLRFDDENDAAKADAFAREIVDQGKALVVIGHYYGNTSAAAGAIYKTNGIPAITGSAMNDDVTAENKWYFRVNPDNRVQALFLAKRMAHEFQDRNVNIVCEDNSYGLSLLENFEKQTDNIGLEIHDIWKINTSTPDIAEEQISEIAEEILRSDPRDILFLSTSGPLGAKIVSALGDERKKFVIFGSESFAHPSWIEHLEECIRERKDGKTAEFYADGIHCAVPFLSSIANETGHLFEKKYFLKYRMKPSWVAACYYDAIRTAIEAMARTDIRSIENVMDNRRKVRDALAGMFKPLNAVSGVAGKIYFDTHGNVTRPFGMITYRGRDMASDLLQYQKIYMDPRKVDHIFEKMLTGEIISINNVQMSSVRIMDVRIDEIQIRGLDFNNQQCDMDFNFRFRHSADYEFDPGCIEFVNSVKPIELGEPVSVETDQNVSTRMYRIHGRFYFTVDHRDFPFDCQFIPIRFRNSSEASRNMILKFDETNAPSKALLEISEPGAGKTEWKIQSVTAKKDSFGQEGVSELPDFIDPMNLINQSQFSIEIGISRRNFEIFAKVFLPVMLLFSVLYMSYFSPPRELIRDAILFITVLATAAAFHFHLLSKFQAVYIMAAEYLIFGIYVLTFISLIYSILVYRLDHEGKTASLRVLRRIGQVVYPLVITAGFIAFIYIYGGKGI